MPEDKRIYRIVVTFEGTGDPGLLEQSTVTHCRQIEKLFSHDSVAKGLNFLRAVFYRDELAEQLDIVGECPEARVRTAVAGQEAPQPTEEVAERLGEVANNRRFVPIREPKFP
jgi:hypothetical protein